MSCETVMDIFKSNFTSLNLDRVHTFSTKKSVPYAYVLPKFKDIERMRPIVSYYNHPLKKSLNLASRALACVLKNADLDDFILWKTQDLNNEIRKINLKLRGQHGNNTKILPFCADIKNMYTELPHEDILKAVRFILEKCKSKTRRSNVTIEKCKQGDAIMGKSVITRTTHICFSFKEIEDICKFDLENIYFKSNGQILQQIRGVPMGSPCSPTLAICVCAYYEHLLTQKLKRYEFKNNTYDCTPIMGAIRYVDDLQAFIAFDKNDPESEELAKSIIQTMHKDAYHPDMKLKAESVSGKWPYLESHLQIISTIGIADKISITYNNKNLDSVIQDQKLKYLTLQHRESFMTKQQSYAKIIGQLHRIDKTVTDRRNKIIAVLEFMIIAKQNGYSPKLIAQCALKVFLKTDNRIWYEISQLVENIYKLWK